MTERKSRHDAFVESLNTYKKNGIDPRTRYVLLPFYKTNSRRRRGDTGLKLCPRGVKSDVRKISTTPSSDTTTEPIDVDKSSDSDKDTLDDDDTESESDKSNSQQSEKSDSKQDSEDNDDASSASSKGSKHIHPCRCDLTEKQLEKIREYEESRRRSKEIFNERLLSVKQYLRDKQGDAKSVTSVTSVKSKSSSRSRKGSKATSKNDDDRKSLQKNIRTIKKKGNRGPKGVKSRQAKTKVLTKKQYGPQRQTKIDITLKLNWKKPPIIPVKQTKTSVLRESERAYCGVRYCRVKAIPICEGDGVIFKVPVDKGTIRDNKTSSLRMQNAKEKKLQTPEKFKYDRPTFEPNPRIYRYLKPIITDAENESITNSEA